MRRSFAWIWMVPALAVWCVAAPQGAGPASCKLFVECGSDELTRAVPDLVDVQFDFNQDRLDGLLAATGKSLADIFAKLEDVAATEQIHQMRFENSMRETSQRETYRYLVRLPGSDLPGASFEELRVEAGTGAPVPPPPGDFLVASQVESLLRYLLPQYRGESRFRYLGRAQGAGQDSWLVAFAQHAGGELDSPAGPGSGQRLQGLVWIDAATYRIVRIRADPAERVAGSPLDTLTTDIAFVPVKFPSTGDVFWLPAGATVHGRFAGGELHSVHRYSDYRLSGSHDAGTAAVAVSAADDPWEMLDHGIALAGGNQAGEAVALLREAVRLSPDMTAARYHLAATLRATGDLAGAETELREALWRAPRSGPAHNLLGILLFKRGDAAGAVVELRASAQLQPTDAIVHFNLGEALEKADPKAALEEFRMASTLAPENEVFRARYERLEHAPHPAAPPEAPGTTFKAEARQVLVPVVVTDEDGHHVTGLKAADFRVFEDGVEQKISGFSVEDLAVASLPSVAAAAPAAVGGGIPTTAVPTAPKPAAVRRTYVISIDTLHSDFASLVRVRVALSKLFASEHAGDAQYVVVAMGTATHVLQGPTTDPAAVVKAIESTDFQKLVAGSRKNAQSMDLQALRHDVDEARRACEANRPECPVMVKALPFRGTQIAHTERAFLAAFLEQLRYLVEDLARESGRRTMVLCSDGFQLDPGKEAFDLLESYFDLPQGPVRPGSLKGEFDAVLRLAAGRDVTIHTVDTRGLYSLDVVSKGALAQTVLARTMSDAWDAGETLGDIAAATGGTQFKNNNDLFAGLERAFADGRQYYLLAYAPGNASSDGKFRTISVVVRDGKLKVNAKRGYWAASVPGGG